MKKEFRIKGGDKILLILKQFSATEKSIFALLVLIMIFTSLLLANKVNRSFLISIPTYGGTLSEGIVGLPRSINPVLAFTDTDRDLSEIVYSGLMKYEQGKLVTDIAQKYSVSDDGLIYTFLLKNNVRFHDGTQLTADDIEFTIQKIQDSTIKSPKRADWANVTVKKISPIEIQFILKQPYSPFISNATIGILPKHIWKNLDADKFVFSQFNTEPIGSGPYKLSNIKKASDGIPEKYSFVSFDKYYNKVANIKSLEIFLYSNEKLAIDAFENGDIESIAGISAQEAVKIASTSPDSNILTAPLPRIFGIFFNQSNAVVLSNQKVRLALNTALDKDRFVNELLYGYGLKIDSPIPSGLINSSSSPIQNNNKSLAIEILTKDGWVKNADGIMEKKDKKSTQTLEFSITTADTPELKKAAEIAKSEWESIGAKITVKVFEYGDLSQNIIKTRKYDALLFGEFVGKDLDLYAFWHSSQRNSPGLNVAMYVNSKTDKLLETARETLDSLIEEKTYKDFEKIIKDEIPAVFIYSPDYIYVVPEKIKGIKFEKITNSSDRWYDINKWYIETDEVWKIFAK